MFDIGFWELILISVVGLVVLGPERLPVAIRNVTRWMRAARNMASSVRNELEQELKIQELQDNLRKAEQMSMKDLSPDLQESVDELKQAARDVQRPYAKPAASATSASSDDGEANVASASAETPPLSSQSSPQPNEPDSAAGKQER
uniref:Sec-independent protein translocase protein TatB n=1 Tax=Thaumasiovibrio occultus TaxID=1891184 RepID=UPI000B34E0A8|nr:Sec-independent protein translocase protein TatB [Thaumasiovibrio occultus]